MNNFYEEIKNIFDDDLDRKTLEYRINVILIQLKVIGKK